MRSATQEFQAPKKWLFHGTANEYFGIWLSNLALTIITLGVFSAWAKVRRNRYMLGNTEIAGSILQYHATGGKIFIGRLLAVGLIMIYSLINDFFPQFYILILIVFACILPWMLDRGMAFRCRMVSWHNIHFRWLGNYRVALKGMLPLLIAFLPYFAIVGLLFNALETEVFIHQEIETYSVYIFAALLFSLFLYPWAARVMAQMVVDHIAWGSLRLKNVVTLKRYVVRVILHLYLALIGGYALSMALIMAIYYVFFDQRNTPPDPFIIFVLLMPFLLVLFSMYRVFRGMMRELITNTTHAIDQQDNSEAVYFHARYSWWGLLKLEVVNLLASIVSLSLLVPWARIRREKYLTEYSAISFGQDPEAMLDVQQEYNSSLAAEYADLDGFDFDPW